MNEDIFNSSIDPELEARIVALVLGEASDFETEELNRLIALRPDLAVFRQQMEEVHGLMQEVGGGEFEAPGNDWKLPADRRNIVLSTIQREAPVQPALEEVAHVVPSVPTRTPWRRRWQRSLTQVLATACFAGAIASYTFYFQSKERTDSQASSLARNDSESFWDKPVRFTYGEAKDGPQPTSSPSASVLLSTVPSPSRGTNFVEFDEQLVRQFGRGDGESRKNSQQALSALSGTLNDGSAKLFDTSTLNEAMEVGEESGAAKDSGHHAYLNDGSVGFVVGNSAGTAITSNSDDGMAVTGPEPVLAEPSVASLMAENDTTNWMSRGFGNADGPAASRASTGGDDLGTQTDDNGNGVTDFLKKSDPAAAVPLDALIADNTPTVPRYVVPPTEGKSSDHFGNDKFLEQPGLAFGLEGEAAFNELPSLEKGTVSSAFSGKQPEVTKAESESLGAEYSSAAVASAKADQNRSEAMPTDGLSIAGQAITVPEADGKVRLSRTEIDATEPESPVAAYRNDPMEALALHDAIDSPEDSPASAEHEPKSLGEEFDVPEEKRETGEAVRGDTAKGLQVNGSLDRLLEPQNQLSRQTSIWEEKLRVRDSREKVGREQSDYGTNELPDVNGEAVNKTDAKWSDSQNESRRHRRMIVDNESQMGGDGFGGGEFEGRGGDLFGRQGQPSIEKKLGIPDEAQSEEHGQTYFGDNAASKAMADFDFNIQEANDSLQSDTMKRKFDRPGAGPGTEAAGSSDSPKLSDPEISFQGDVNGKQDLGLLNLNGDKADVSKVEATIRAIEADQVQSLSQKESGKPGEATNGGVITFSDDGNKSGEAIDSGLPQRSSGLEARDSARSDVVTGGTEVTDLKKNADGKTGDDFYGHQFQVDGIDQLQPLARAKSKAAIQLKTDVDGDNTQGVPADAKQTPGDERVDALQSEAGRLPFSAGKPGPMVDGPGPGVVGTFRYQGRALSEDSRFDTNPEAFRKLMSQAGEKSLSERTVAPSVSLNETTATAEAFSTFSLHVSDVSFKLAAAALARGEWPEAAKVRIEEFVNAFDYGDPLPCNGEKVACVVEQSIHPFLQQRNILRVSMRTGAEGRAKSTPLRLTFLLDNSGSMERADRQDTVRRAFALLAQQLTPIDQVTLISFARQPRLLAENVSGAEAGQLVKLIDELPSEGGTNIEAALRLAFEKATQQQTTGAQNRIILLTDGAVNLGDADPESLSRMVTMMRDSGVAFDAAGISAEGLNDEVLEALTRKGDGRYYLLDSFENAHESFVQQVAGALRPSASNVKVQIEFNPKRVGHYKLLGFEKHVLKQEDFRNDAVDAAEMAAAEAGVAVYQFEAKPDGEGDVGSVSVRFRDLSTGQMVENRWPIPYEADAPRPDQAAPSLRIATSAALLAAKLRGEPLGEAVDLGTLSDLVSGLPILEQNNPRVQQLKQMIEQARQVSGK